MDDVSQLFAVGEYALTDGAFSQLENLISARTTMSQVRNWVLTLNHTSVMIRLMKNEISSTSLGLLLEV